MNKRPLPGALLWRVPPPILASQLLGLALMALLDRVAAQKSTILARMGDHRASRFLIDLKDSPTLLLLTPAALRVSQHPRWSCPGHDVAICGDLPAFLSMLHRSDDHCEPSRFGALTMSGDTDAVHALCQALEAADLDLTRDLAILPGEPYELWLRRMSELAATRAGPVMAEAAA